VGDRERIDDRADAIGAQEGATATERPLSRPNSDTGGADATGADEGKGEGE
jgi:hypothetical protein